jgi:predicted RNA-binding protein with TRAM domain
LAFRIEFKRFLRNDRCGDRGGGFGSKAPTKTPMSIEEEYDVKVEDVKRQANIGIGKIEDFVNFVSNASPGEKVMAGIVNMGIGVTGLGMTANEPIEREKPIKEKCL